MGQRKGAKRSEGRFKKGIRELKQQQQQKLQERRFKLVTIFALS